MADDFTRSIEDNYPEYVLETFGYQYDALEVIDREALTRHDNLRHASREELERAMGDGASSRRSRRAPRRSSSSSRHHHTRASPSTRCSSSPSSRG